MRIQYLIIILLMLALSCGKSKKEAPISQREQQIEEEKSYYSLAIIDDEKTNLVKPSIEEWLEECNLDVNEFRYLETDSISDWDSDVNTLYYLPFESEVDDVYLPQLRDYSSDKNMFVNILESLLVYLENDTLKYYGSDDSQYIYLTDRNLQKKKVIQWLGVSTHLYDCFWIDNNKFVLIGTDYYEEDRAYCFYLYSLSEKVYHKYIWKDIGEERRDKDYFINNNLKRRNVPVLMY